ncbi:Deoxyribose-phosphate aldolase [Coniochaeta hoffmannii]|uniref:deoxyribose-phosphate aldolase n=1 Tax=Coniochaeta hoffmannii TaxID=91930 RepID=A0AA38VW35_9PEZI|nr:Deoxyribose-phosphate aldolase [Coniochaeta hoffmannii]
MPTLTVTLPLLAKQIDHSLLHPTLTDASISAGLSLSRAHNVAAACVKPYSVSAARQALAGSDVLVCSVVGFPHGNSTTAIKVLEAAEAVSSGAHEVDVVVNIGKVLGGEWDYVRDEIGRVNDVVTSTPVGGGDNGETAILKVIFENDYLQDEHIVRLCRICTEIGVAFVKTSTGYGFVKQGDETYSYKGATAAHLKLMKESVGAGVKIKAAGGVRTLDEMLYVMWLGVDRVGATATEAILGEARRRGIGDVPVEVEVKTDW